MLHVSFQAISSWECGNTLPDIENLCQLSEIFGTSLDLMLQKKPTAPNEPAVIGIHGAGSASEVVLVTQSGRILKHVRLPGTNASVIGVESVFEILCHGIDLCLSEQSDVQGILFGNAGGHLDELTALLSERYSGIEVSTSNVINNLFFCAEGYDVVLLWENGTGISFRDEDGRPHGLGGWGYVFGDPASAYSLGREAIRLALAFEEGLGGSALVYSLLKKKLGLYKIRGSFSHATVAHIARQTDVFMEAYLAGDNEVERVLNAEIDALATQIKVACARAGNCVVVSGDMITRYHQVLLPLLQRAVGAQISFLLPKLPPVYGACMDACRTFDVPPTEGFSDRFLQDYGMLQ